MAIDHNDPRIAAYKVVGKVLVSTDGTGIAKHPGSTVSKEQAKRFGYDPCLAPIDVNEDEIFSTPERIKMMQEFSPESQRKINGLSSQPETMNKMERFAEMEKDAEKKQVWEKPTIALPSLNTEPVVEKKALNLAADTTADVNVGRGKRGKRDITISTAPAAVETPAIEV